MNKEIKNVLFYINQMKNYRKQIQAHGQYLDCTLPSKAQLTVLGPLLLITF